MYRTTYNFEPPDETENSIYRCEHCDRPIYEGDKYFDIDCELLCENCVDLIYSKFAQAAGHPEDDY